MPLATALDLLVPDILHQFPVAVVDDFLTPDFLTGIPTFSSRFCACETGTKSARLQLHLPKRLVPAFPPSHNNHHLHTTSVHTRHQPCQSVTATVDERKECPHTPTTFVTTSFSSCRGRHYHDFITTPTALPRTPSIFPRDPTLHPTNPDFSLRRPLWANHPIEHPRTAHSQVLAHDSLSYDCYILERASSTAIHIRPWLPRLMGAASRWRTPASAWSWWDCPPGARAILHKRVNTSRLLHQFAQGPLLDSSPVIDTVCSRNIF